MCDLTKPHFQDADKAREYLEALRWPDGPVCPHCGSIGGWPIKGGRKGLYRCKQYQCRMQFSVTVGTVFERSKVPLNKWLMAVYLMSASKKGMSAHQIHRMIGVTYKTAWFMCHRIREAMKEEGGPLGGNGGIVEVDETFYGKKKDAESKGAGAGHKMSILTLVERGGKARSYHVANVRADTLKPILKKQIAEGAKVYSDSAGQYRKIGLENHEYVRHYLGEYVRGDVHSNTVESYFSLLKRGLFGTFHHVSEQHLKRYVCEFDFRHNYRAMTDSQRANIALQGIAGKRLTYLPAGAA